MSETKRVNMHIMVTPETRDTINRLRIGKQSQGELIDLAVAAYDDASQQLGSRAPRKRASKKDQRAAELAASDPAGQGRDDIVYGGSETVPSSGSVVKVGAARPVASLAGPRPHSMHSGVRPIAGCKQCAQMAKALK